MKVVVARNVAPALIEPLRERFPRVRFQTTGTVEDELREIADAEVYVGLPSREVFLAARNLRWIHEPGTGIDRIASVPELVASDVPLTNARGPHASTMADHVFAQLLALTHHVVELWEEQKARRWDGRAFAGGMVDLEGKSMGILALGGIGQAVARRAVGFGLRVIAVDLRPVAPPPGVEAVWGEERLDDLLSISDVLVVTAPLTAKTRGLIDRRRIGLLRRGAYLIVVSRGGIVDEGGLADALRSGHLAGAGLDVTDREPLPPDSPLWAVENLLLSPHCSASSPGLNEGRREVLAENLRRYLAGEPFLYVCDKLAGF